jgi:hypothetical protein
MIASPALAAAEMIAGQASPTQAALGMGPSFQRVKPVLLAVHF